MSEWTDFPKDDLTTTAHWCAGCGSGTVIGVSRDKNGRLVCFSCAGNGRVAGDAAKKGVWHPCDERWRPAYEKWWLAIDTGTRARFLVERPELRHLIENVIILNYELQRAIDQYAAWLEKDIKLCGL
jgi:hypothetical protein